jgi:hypothetical protein
MSLQHRLLRISSRDRDKTSDPTHDFTINLNNIDGVHNLKSVIVKHVSFENVFYNIDENNRTFTYNIASSPTSVQIPIGQYNSTTFMTALDLAATGVGLVTSLDALTSKFSFTSTTNIEFLAIASNPMAEVLGIEADSGSDAGTYSATGVVSLQGIRNVYIRSSSLSFGNLVNSNEGVNHDCIAVVPITGAYGSIINYITQHDNIDDVDSDSSSGKNIQKIGIKLTDYAGNLLDLHSHHITIVLKVYY